MRLSSLQVFISIAECGSISSAAKREHLTQPAISAIISSLEEEVGTKLVVRSRGQRSRVELTPAGVIFESFARQTTIEYSQSLLEIAKAHRNIKPIQLVTSPTPGATVFPVLKNSFQSLYPDIIIRSSTTSSPDAIFRTLLTNESSICISGSKADHPSLISERFFRDEIILIAPPSMDLNPQISIKEFLKLPLVVRPEETSNISKTIFKTMAEKKDIEKTSLNIIMEVGGDADILQAVSLGSGVGFITNSLFVVTEKTHHVKRVNIRGLSFNRYLYLTRNTKNHLSTEARLFWDYAMSMSWRKGVFPVHESMAID